MAKPKKKHSYRHCKVCKKKTRHVQALFGLPFDCVEHHPTDNIRCQDCGRPFSADAIKFAESIGATIRYCPGCQSVPVDTPDWLRVCIRKRFG